MTVEINGIEINLANVNSITPIEEYAERRWYQFLINMSIGTSIPFAFINGQKSSPYNPHNLESLNELQAARQKIIDKLNEK